MCNIAAEHCYDTEKAELERKHYCSNRDSLN